VVSRMDVKVVMRWLVYREMIHIVFELCMVYGLSVGQECNSSSQSVSILNSERDRDGLYMPSPAVVTGYCQRRERTRTPGTQPPSTSVDVPYIQHDTLLLACLSTLENKDPIHEQFKATPFSPKNHSVSFVFHMSYTMFYVAPFVFA